MPCLSASDLFSSAFTASCEIYPFILIITHSFIMLKLIESTKFLLLSFALALLFPQSAFAWGQKGHDVIAYVAEQHLTDATRQKVDSIFDGMSMVYWANWLDNASHTPDYKYTSSWHYKNIDVQYTYEEAPVIPSGNIITALTAVVDTLSCDTISKASAQFNMKLIVHLIGDLHQPMHFGRLTDIGGNRTSVIFFHRDKNLHGIWDTEMVEQAHNWSYTEWQQQLDRLSQERQNEIVQGSFDDWGKEIHAICYEIYETTPHDESLEYDYVAHWTPVIETVLMKGGLRLAHVLNSIFDPTYSSPVN